MEREFVLPDVSAEAIMTIVKSVTSSAQSLSEKDISIAMESRYKPNYVKLCLTACLQLKLLTKNDGNFQATLSRRDEIKRSDKKDLIVFFRETLQNYPPFLLYADFLSTGYSSKDSASMLRGILKIGTGLEKSEKTLRSWGIASKLVVKENGELKIPQAEKGLPATYVKELLKALDSEFTAKIFFVNILSPEVYSFLNSLDLDIDELSKALISYEDDPKTAMGKALSFFENFLHKFGNELGVNLAGKMGVNGLVKELFEKGKILKNQESIGNGLGGCRNISAHGVDKDTQKEWVITPQAALSTIILVPVTIRSYFSFGKQNEQIF